MMPLRGGGWLQGYNCQATTSSDGLIIATSVGNNPSDTTAFSHHHGQEPPPPPRSSTLFTAPANSPGHAAGIGVVLADAGYLSTDNLTAARTRPADRRRQEP